MVIRQFFTQKGTIKIVVYCILFACCALPINVFAEDDDYYSSWELQHSGRYNLVWYYKTENDFNKKQPNWVLARAKKFVIFPHVRPPTINGIYLLENSKVNEGEEVLDIGTGSGIHAVFAAEKAKRVVATDIYAPAVENAKVNAKSHGVEDLIDFRVGDLFEPLDDDERFDVFFININFPFSVGNKDRNRLHERLFSEIHKYMKPNARIYFQTSFIRNIPYIYDMLKRNQLSIMELHMEHMFPSRHEPLFMMIQHR